MTKIGQYIFENDYKIKNIPFVKDGVVGTRTYDPFESETVPFWLVGVESYQTLTESNREYLMNRLLVSTNNDQEKAKEALITRVYYTLTLAESTQKFLDSDMTELVFNSMKEALTAQAIFLSLQEQNVKQIVKEVQQTIDLDKGSMDPKTDS